MKKIKLLMIAAVTIALAACSSPEKRAQKLIKEYLAEDLEFPKTYKPDEFGKLEEVYSDYKDSQAYRAFIQDVEMSEHSILTETSNIKAYETMRQTALQYHLDTRDYDEQIAKSKANVQKYEARVRKYQHKADSVRDNFVPELIGYSMEHDYKYNNGKTVVDDYSVFIFDLDITTIVREE